MFMNDVFMNDVGAAFPITTSIIDVVPDNRNACKSGTTARSRQVSSPVSQTIHKLQFIKCIEAYNQRSTRQALGPDQDRDVSLSLRLVLGGADGYAVSILALAPPRRYSGPST